ncbi:MAG: hypothetical protein P5683_24135 [Limnospira sp. PMC 1279.21]|uniref:Uncharacterized protein n=4 Tax=Limnospira TaxID=2596745 RepID=A0A9P1KBH0_9CYAN|nr:MULTISPECIES: hypothetical protein [Limnospira]MDT9195995.1 hypothetical protein [Limnospira sp. PMC 1245.20]MDT9267450.1 hypothetical protein [Limnospira sp. PMC 1223.20]MDT9226676.1 hypothetical protein [Limnospira sp. PMC 1279.21]MDT9246981.1 hypothetical protein [Limnospira sp. PMC 1249.20]MDT9257258.1 hypothetical protein [Limnospira sp. PMC 1254.20]
MMNSTNQRNPQTQYTKQLKEEVLKSIENISVQVSSLWLKAQVQNPNEPLTRENISNYLEQLARAVKVEANNYSENLTDNEDKHSPSSWVHLVVNVNSLMDCLVHTKAKIENTIINLTVIDFASNTSLINEPEAYAKHLEYCHGRIYVALEDALAELEDLDFTA